MQALRDAQARASLAETHNQSLLIENAELRGENNSLKAQARQLIEADISVAVKGIIRSQQDENVELRSELRDIHAKHEVELDLVTIRAEVAEEERKLAEEENQRLLHDLEARLSVESFVEMANQELEELKLKYDALRSELTEKESAESVRSVYLAELTELRNKLEEIDKLMLSDLSPIGFRMAISALSSASIELMQTDDPIALSDGFKLQTAILKRWSSRREPE